jgi:hypothetical protein
LAAFVVLAAWQPAGGAESSICLFRRATGVPCPGCGLTRAFAALAKGHFSQAFAFHPFAYLIALEALAGYLGWGWFVLKGRDWPERWSSRIGPLATGHIAALLALWLGRLATGTLPW